ncbi:hypothetical protein CC79DRAFT_1375986 [Sarocladium strictum]
MARSTLALPWAKSPRATPLRIDSDKVVPMRFFDDTATLRTIVMAWMFRFEDVLDVDKLHSAVTELLNIPSWRQLGGRLRLNEHGKLEIHIPSHFTAARPGVRFSHDDFRTKIEHHPLASRLPKSKEGPSLQPGAMEFKTFGSRPGAPSTLEDYLYNDEPQLAMHVTSFEDATLVSLAFPHTMSDAMGISALMSAISLVLAGRTAEVPDLPDAADDVLQNVGTHDQAGPPEPYALAEQRIGGFGSIVFGLNFAWDMFWRPRVEVRTGFLPAAFVNGLRVEAEADLRDLADEEKPPFLSDGDILTAWGCIMILRSEVRLRPAIILNVLNVRGRLPSTTTATGMFIQNLTFNSNALLSASEVQGVSLGLIAAKVRKALIQQTTEPQLQAIIRESRAAYTATGTPPLYGPSNAGLIVVSNWDKAKLFEATDFRPAVVDAENTGQERDHEIGRPVYHHAHTLKEGRPTRNFWNIIGKDLKGDYWFSGTLFPETWKLIEQAIRLG